MVVYTVTIKDKVNEKRKIINFNNKKMAEQYLNECTDRMREKLHPINEISTPSFYDNEYCEISLATNWYSNYSKYISYKIRKSMFNFINDLENKK